MSLTIHATPVPLSADPTGTIRVAGTRVTLDTLIGHYRAGASVEAIAERLPVLNPADIHAVLAYYLRHRAEVDRYLEEQAAQGDAAVASLGAHHQSWEKVSERLRARPVAEAGDDASVPRR